jgi:hypothetical protein
MDYAYKNKYIIFTGRKMKGTAHRAYTSLKTPRKKTRKNLRFQDSISFELLRLKLVFLALIIALCSWLGYSQTSDIYGSITDSFSLFTDPNTGLTVFPTLLIPYGGLYEGMGTAFTAVSSDSGFIDSNPAGSSMLSYSELSLLHHSWIADANIEGLIYTFKINDLGLGFGGKVLYLPFTAYNDVGDRGASGYISESIGTANISYNLFSNYYFSGISLGANLKLAYRNIPDSIYLNQSAFAAMADVGILTRFDFLKFYSSRTNNFSIGVAFKNLGLATLGEPLPTLLSAGFAYSFIRPVLWSVDFNLPISFDPANYPAESWYIASGLLVNFTKFFSMHAGFRVKENPFLSLGCDLDFQDLSLVANYNLDLSGSINPLDKMSIEAKIKLGYSAYEKKQKQVDDLFAKGIDSYANGNFAEAIQYWQSALDMDPKFTIAEEYIKTTKDYLDLQTKMDDKQNSIER